MSLECCVGGGREHTVPKGRAHAVLVLRASMATRWSAQCQWREREHTVTEERLHAVQRIERKKRPMPEESEHKAPEEREHVKPEERAHTDCARRESIHSGGSA